MKRTVFTVIIMFILVMFFVSCGWKVEIVDPTKPIEKEQELVVPDKEKPEESEQENITEEKPEEEIKGPEISVEQKLPSVEGDYVELKTEGGSIAYFKILEFEDKIIAYSDFENIAAFDVKTGEKLYEYTLGDINECGVFDIVKNDYKGGLDFSVSMKDKIIYLSSENPELIEIVPLPENVMETKSQNIETYSVHGNKIVWISEGGIRMSDLDGKNEEMLIPAEDIETKIKPMAKKAYDDLYYVDNSEVCYFYEVSFICGGEKVAVTVTSEKTFLYWATALYDIESGEFEWAYLFNEMVNADYPFGDKYILVGKKFINAETGDYKNFKVWSRTVNGTDFIRSETDDMENHGLKIFCGDRDSIEEGGKKIFEITDEGVSGYIEGISENYVLACVHVYGNEWYCLVKYR